MSEGSHYNDIDFDLDWLDDFDVSGSVSRSAAAEQPSRPYNEQAPVSEERYTRPSRPASEQSRTRQPRPTMSEQQPVRQPRSEAENPRTRQSRPTMSHYERSRSVEKRPSTQRSRLSNGRSAGRQSAPTMSGYEQARQGSRRPPRPSRRGKANIPLTIVAIVLAAAMLYACWQLVSILMGYRRDSSAYNDLADQATALLAEQDEVSEPEATPTADTETEEVSEIPISVDWDYLQSINDEIIGWLYCPDSVINYPVMQTSDNSYYLYKNYKDEDAGAGALFADTDAVSGITRSNFIIYGHNMKNNSMFGTLDKYTDEDYYKAHPSFYFLTPTASYRIELISAHIVESTLDNYPTYFEDESEYQDYLDYITSCSFFTTDATVSTEYQLLTMSTCNYSSAYEDGRLLLQGMMVPIT